MKLLFVTGSRGEWGYIRPILQKCNAPDTTYHICATNMHLLPAFGQTVKEIEADGFEVHDEIYMSLEGHNHFTMAKSLSIFASSFVDLLNRVRPDWLVLAGDRGEQLMAATMGAYTYTPIAHIQAGELSGNIDGVARHAITKLVHLHFAANEDASERLRRLGEEPFRIHNVGAPQLDDLVDGRITARKDLEKAHSLDLSRPYLLLVQHPVTEEMASAEHQAKVSVEALNSIDMPKICVLPNNDAGSSLVRNSILRHRSVKFTIFESLKRADYLGLLKNATAIVGNSSSGILEAPTFLVPAINLGRRQVGRMRAANAIDVPFEREAIIDAVKQALDPDYRAKLQGCENPYGKGRSAKTILDILRSTTIDSRLLQKQMTY